MSASFDVPTLTAQDIELINNIFLTNPTLRHAKKGMEYGKGNILPCTVIKADNGCLYMILDHLLGKGNFGKVKMAINLTTKNECVIKKQKLNLDIKNFHSYLKMLTREIEISEELEPQVSSASKVKKSKKELVKYIILPYYEGKSFAHYKDLYNKSLLNYDKLPLLEKVNLIHFSFAIVKSVCDDLNKAHRKYIIHRDLHSENLLIDKDGKAIIIDWGRGVKLDPITKDISGYPAEAGIKELWTEEMKKVDEKEGLYTFTTADDLYALGITFSKDLRMSEVLEKIQTDDKLQEMFNISKDDIFDLIEMMDSLLDDDSESRVQLDTLSSEIGKHLDKFKKYLVDSENVDQNKTDASSHRKRSRAAEPSAYPDVTSPQKRKKLTESYKRKLQEPSISAYPD